MLAWILRLSLCVYYFISKLVPHYRIYEDDEYYGVTD
jgi:hypothetical protein